MFDLETIPELTRDQIAAAALELVKLPYKHHGREEELGLDCAGVLVATFRKCGATLRELPINYGRLPQETHVRECLRMNFDQSYDELRDLPLTLIELEPGQILHIRFNRDDQARHLGILTLGQHSRFPNIDVFNVVHSLRANRRVILEPLGGVLAHAKIVGVHEWPKLRS